MSEDRTQAPSARRRQQAREQGHAAHSPELTAAAACLAAVLLLGAWGDSLARALVALVRGPLEGGIPAAIGPAEVISLVRGHLAAVAAPTLGIAAGSLLAALAVHQLQVRGLWATSLIAPDPSRLWSPGRAFRMGEGAGRSAWSVVKAVALVSAGGWAMRSEWAALCRLASLEPESLAAGVGQAILGPARTLGLVLLALGAIDFALRYARFEEALQTTPDEQREDQKAMEGDMALRGRRRRLARAWRGDAPEFLAGATLLLAGRDGLTLVLGGGPPPRGVTVRAAARGRTGLQLRRTASTRRIDTLDDPDLAHRLMVRIGSTSELPCAFPPSLLPRLASRWAGTGPGSKPPGRRRRSLADDVAAAGDNAG